jgi:hypothetical protein
MRRLRCGGGIYRGGRAESIDGTEGGRDGDVRSKKGAGEMAEGAEAARGVGDGRRKKTRRDRVKVGGRQAHLGFRGPAPRFSLLRFDWLQSIIHLLLKKKKSIIHPAVTHHQVNWRPP